MRLLYLGGRVKRDDDLALLLGITNGGWLGFRLFLIVVCEIAPSTGWAKRSFGFLALCARWLNPFALGYDDEYMPRTSSERRANVER